MATDPLSYLQALIAKDFLAPEYARRKEQAGHEPLLITLSREYGAEGEAVARQLAECLGIPVYDQEILELVAKHARTDKFFFEPHDEKVSAGLTAFLHGLVSSAPATMQSYRRHLYDVVLDIARSDCLIIGRGAHLILATKQVFRVRIVGSTPVCAGRIAARFGISQAEAEQKVAEVNDMRHKSVIRLFGESFAQASLEQASCFDLVINTDRIAADGARLVILMAMQQAGFDVSRARFGG